MKFSVMQMIVQRHLDEYRNVQWGNGAKKILKRRAPLDFFLIVGVF